MKSLGEESFAENFIPNDRYIDIMRDIYILHCCTNVSRSQGFKVGFKKEKFVPFFDVPTHRVYKVVGC